MSAAAPNPNLREPILDTFRRNDPNGDGKLNLQQLCSVLETLGLTQNQLNDLLAAAAIRWPKGEMPFEDLINWVFEEREAYIEPDTVQRNRCRSVTGADGEVGVGEKVMMMMNDYGEDHMVSGTVLTINYAKNEVDIQFEDGCTYKGPASYVFRMPNNELIIGKSMETGAMPTFVAGPDYELFYWAMPGRAEPIRQAFVVAGMTFKDQTPETLPDFMERKEATGVQVPFLTVDGRLHTQSKAILLYVGKVAQYEGRPLYPKAPEEAYWCDQLVDQVEDMVESAASLMFIEDKAEKDKAIAMAFSDEGVMTKNLKLLEKRLESFGPNVNIGDLCAFSWVGQVRSQAPQGAFNKYPNLNKHHDFVAKLAPLMKHYGQQPESPFRPLTI